MFGGGMEVGSVFARLGAQLDERGFEKFDRRRAKAEQQAHRRIEQTLGVRLHDEGFRRYEGEDRRARTRARNPITQLLNARSDTRGFRQFDNAANTSRGHVKRLGNELNQTGRHARQFGQGAGVAMAGGATLAGIAIGRAAGQVIGFDKAMRNVNSIAQLSEGRFKGLEKQVLSLAGKTAQAPQTLAEGLYDIVSSGFKAKDAMTVLSSSAKAATAGLTDTGTSTHAVVSILNAYHLKAGDAAKVSDQLFSTVNYGVISFEQLSSTIGDVLPFSAALHVGLDQVGASIATMTKAGISAPETMTRLKSLMEAFIKPSDAMAEAIKKTGAESGEALIRQKGFQGGLEAIVGATDGSKAAIAKLFPNIRALGGALALTGINAKTANGDLANMTKTSGATDKALSQQSRSISYRWQKTKADLQATAITIGSKVIPPVLRALNLLTDPKLSSTEKFDRLSKMFEKGLIGLAHIFEKLAPKMADAAAHAAPVVAAAFVHSFMAAGVWGKLTIAAILLKKLGGFSLLGRIAADRFLGGFGPRMTRGAAAAMPAPAGPGMGARGLAFPVGVGGAGANAAKTGAMARLGGLAKGVLRFALPVQAVVTLVDVVRRVSSGKHSFGTDPVGSTVTALFASGRSEVKSLTGISLPEVTVDLRERVNVHGSVRPDPKFKAVFDHANADLVRHARDSFEKQMGRTRFPLPSTVLRSMTRDLNKIPPEFRGKAAESMLQFTRQMERDKRLPAGTTTRLIKELGQRFNTLGPMLKVAGAGSMTALARTFREGKILSEANRQVGTIGRLWGKIPGLAHVNASNAREAFSKYLDLLTRKMHTGTEEQRRIAGQKWSELHALGVRYFGLTAQDGAAKMSALRGSVAASVRGAASIAAERLSALKSSASSNFSDASSSARGFASAVGEVTGKIGSLSNDAGSALDRLAARLRNMPKGPSVPVAGPGRARGGRADAPMIVWGEEAPAYPEYFISTNPRDRGRTKSLMGELAGRVGASVHFLKSGGRAPAKKPAPAKANPPARAAAHPAAKKTQPKPTAKGKKPKPKPKPVAKPQPIVAGKSHSTGVPTDQYDTLIAINDQLVAAAEVTPDRGDDIAAYTKRQAIIDDELRRLAGVGKAMHNRYSGATKRSKTAKSKIAGLTAKLNKERAHAPRPPKGHKHTVTTYTTDKHGHRHKHTHHVTDPVPASRHQKYEDTRIKHDNRLQSLRDAIRTQQDYLDDPAQVIQANTENEQRIAQLQQEHQAATDRLKELNTMPEDAESYLTDAEKRTLGDAGRDFAVAQVATPSPDPNDPATTQAMLDAAQKDDIDAARRIRDVWAAALLRVHGTKGLPPIAEQTIAENLLSARQTYDSLTGAKVADSGTSPDDVAKLAAEQIASFNASRAALFGSFGSNYMLPGQSLSPLGQAAGSQYFGAESSGAGVGPVVHLEVNHAEGPSDPHLWSARTAAELRAVL